MRNEQQPDSSHRISVGAVVITIIPVITLLTSLAVLSGAFGLVDVWERYESHRKFWGGNPAEVYSHWLDMVLMSGNATALAWLLVAEMFFRRNQTRHRWLIPLNYACGALGLVLSSAVAVALDRAHGEGTVLLAFMIFFVPILGSSYYLLRQLIGLLRRSFPSVVALSLSYAVLNTAAQLYYEPSQTGAPGFRVFPIWLGSVGLAVIWAFVRGIRSGGLRRFCG